MAKINELDSSATKYNSIVAGTVLKGDIEANDNIRFDGTLIGNLRTKGKLVIGGTGEIKGEVFSKNCDVEGKIEGKINVSELLTLKSTALIKGDIEANRLAIEPGAKFTGNCKMGNDAGQSTGFKKEEKSAK